MMIDLASPTRSLQSNEFLPKIGNLNKTLSIISDLQNFKSSSGAVRKVVE